MKNKIISCLVAITVTAAVSAQSQSKFDAMQERYNQFKQQAEEKYESFRDQANKKYVNFLLTSWEKFDPQRPLPTPNDEPIPPVIFKEEDRRPDIDEKILEDYYKDMVQHQRDEEIENPDIHVDAKPIKDEFDSGKPHKGQDGKPDNKQYGKVKHENDEEIEDIPDRSFYHNIPKVDLPTVVPVVAVIHQPEPQPQPQPIEPVKQNKNVKFERTIPLSLYGTEVAIHIPNRKFTLDGIEGKQIAKAWDDLSSSDFDNVLYDCLKARKDLKLCDWAYLTLLQTVGETLCGGKNNAAVAMQAYLYTQSGYKMRFGTTADGRLVMLVGSKYSIYDRTYYKIGNDNFFAFEPIEGSLRICPEAFDNEQALSLVISDEQDIVYDPSPVRTLQTRKGTSAAVSINRNLMEFYDTYPSGQYGDDKGSRWALYANTPLDEGIKRTLYPALKTAIQGKKEEEAANVLLDWVQNAFAYQYDNVIWGQDRAFFAEETLFYPYSDCEDRSILFTRLVRDLLGLDAVLIHYPGHLATAVAFNDNVHGDCIFVDGRRYTIADPTFLGAPVGYTMTGKDNATAKVIMLK